MKHEVLLLGGFNEVGPGTRERILDNEFNEWFQAAGERNLEVIFVADACYSGLSISTRGAVTRGQKQGRIARMMEKPGMVSMTGGTADQRTHEEGDHGVFTQALLRGLKGYADGNADGAVSSIELAVFVR